MNKELPESWKSKGIGAPSYLFSVLVIITAIFETFKGIPFALVSAVGFFLFGQQFLLLPIAEKINS